MQETGVRFVKFDDGKDKRSLPRGLPLLFIDGGIKTVGAGKDRPIAAKGYPCRVHIAIGTVFPRWHPDLATLWTLRPVEFLIKQDFPEKPRCLAVTAEIFAAVIVSYFQDVDLFFPFHIS